MCFPVNIGNVLRTAFSVGHRAPVVAAFNKDRGKNVQMKKKKKKDNISFKFYLELCRY